MYIDLYFKNRNNKKFIAKLGDFDGIFTHEMYGQFVSYIHMYKQMSIYNKELYALFRQFYCTYYKGSYKTLTSEVLDEEDFKIFLKVKEDKKYFSRDWSNVKFPAYNAERISKLTISMFNKVYGREEPKPVAESPVYKKQ